MKRGEIESQGDCTVSHGAIALMVPVYGYNAVAEGVNSKIMSIKRRVGGFRNVENFKIAIFFYCGGLDLYPRQNRMDRDYP
ncbi:MAG: transposase [Planctomycetota bacterium]